MASKKSGKKKAAKRSVQYAKSKLAKAMEDDTKPFDFGGIPERNLKKNLGC